MPESICSRSCLTAYHFQLVYLFLALLEMPDSKKYICDILLHMLYNYALDSAVLAG